MGAVISSEKHLIYQGNTPNGDGKGEPSENAELFLETLKFRFRSIKKIYFAELPTDPLELVEHSLFENCLEKDLVSDLCEVLEILESLTFNN